MKNTVRRKLGLVLVLVLGLGFSLVMTRLATAQGPAGTRHSEAAITTVDFKVTATDPVTNEVGVPLSQTINLTYNMAISATTVNTGTIVAQGMMGGLLTGTYSVEGAHVTLTPSRPLFPNEIVRTTATSGTESLGGSAAVPYQWQFTAGEVADRCVADFSQQSTAPTGVRYSSVAWGDYDNDDDLDILLAGQSDSGFVTEVWRNDGGGTFSQLSTSLTGVGSGGVAWGDYDNDGDLDILLAGYTGFSYVTEVWSNDGASGGGWAFSQQSAAPTGINNGSVAWGDYDNDGDLDILLAGWTGLLQVTEVWRNDGASGGGWAFSQQSTAPTGVEYASVAWGDYDDDGDLDILLAGHTGSQAVTEVWRNDGAGAFSQHSTALTGVSSASVAWGDYDNDDDLDILLAGRTGSAPVTEVWRNDGGGAFSQQSTAPTGVTLASAGWGDYDNDGDLDILLAGTTGSVLVTEVWRNDSAGAFSQQPTALTGVRFGGVAWGDYDNDGDLDILVAGETLSAYVAEVWRNDDCPAVTATDPVANEVAVPLAQSINLTYSQAVSATTVNTGTIVAQGLMGGLLTGTYSVEGGYVTLTPSRSLFPNEIVRTTVTSGTESLDDYAVVPYQWQFTAGEVADRCIADLSQQSTAPTGVYYGSVAWGDYDNDGDLDILLAGDNGSGGASAYVTAVWRNDGGGTFSQQSTAPTGVFAASVAWGDYDNDGDLDILLAGWNGSGEVTEVWRNDGGGTFSQQSTAPTGIEYGSVAWGDYDNDGDLDILLTGWTGSVPVTEVWRNDGGGTFGQESTALTALYRSSVAWGDYDSDGDLDILLAGWSSGTGYVTEVWRNDGATGGGWAFNLEPGALTGVRYSSVAWGDYDNDGNLDILLAGGTSSAATTEVWHNDGATGGGWAFSQQSTAPTGVEYASVAWGDYDNDGDLDILLAGETSTASVTEVWRNDGGGTFSQQPAALTGVDHASVAWGDYDNDGDLDILFAGTTGSAYVTEVWRNDDCPEADAGPEQTAFVGSAVNLDGTASADPNGGPLSYRWTQTGGPDVSFSPGLSLTTFAAPAAPAVLGFRLTVTTGQGYTATDGTVVTVTAIPPVIPTYTLSLHSRGEGSGSAAASPEQGAYDEGTVVTLTAAANAGSTFAGWSGDLTGQTNPITLTMDGDKVVTVTFGLEATGHKVYLPVVLR